VWRFYKIIRIGWVGYRASNQGQKLDLALDILTILFEIAPEVTLETISEKVKPNC
jgi:hypothetical protein